MLNDDTVLSARIYPLVIYVNFQKSTYYHYHHTSYLYAIWFWNLLLRYYSQWVKWICLWRFIARYLSIIQLFLTGCYKKRDKITFHYKSKWFFMMVVKILCRNCFELTLAKFNFNFLRLKWWLRKYLGPQARFFFPFNLHHCNGQSIFHCTLICIPLMCTM